MAVACRVAFVMMHYSIIANNYWLLVEGIYLYNLLVVTVFTERNYFNIYLCIGWGECVSRMCRNVSILLANLSQDLKSFSGFVYYLPQTAFWLMLS